MTLKELFGVPFDHVKDVYLTDCYFIYKVDIDSLLCFDKDNNLIGNNHGDIIYGSIDIPVELITDLDPNCWTREQKDVFRISYRDLNLLVQSSIYKYFADIFKSKGVMILLHDMLTRGVPVKEEKFLNWLDSIK